jgi:hypothetical protein
LEEILILGKTMYCTIGANRRTKRIVELFRLSCTVTLASNDHSKTVS